MMLGRKDVITALNGFPVKKETYPAVQFGLQGGGGVGLGTHGHVCRCDLLLKRFERPKMVNNCCCLPGTVLCVGSIAVNKTDDHPGPLRAYVLVHGVASYNLWAEVSPLFLACTAHELSHF